MNIISSMGQVPHYYGSVGWQSTLDRTSRIVFSDAAYPPAALELDLEEVIYGPTR